MCKYLRKSTIKYKRKILVPIKDMSSVVVIPLTQNPRRRRAQPRALLLAAATPLPLLSV